MRSFSGTILESDHSVPSSVARIVTAKEWNPLILRLGGALEQAHEWGEVLRRDGWTPHRYACDVATTSAAALSIMARRLRGLPYSVLYAPRGPVWDRQYAMPWDAIDGVVRQLAAATRAIFLRVSPDVPCTATDVRASFIAAGFCALDDDWTTWNAPRIVLHQDLHGHEPEILARIRKNTRYEIRTAMRRGVVVRVEANRDRLNLFHSMLIETGRRNRYPIRSTRRLDALWEEYVSRGDGVLLMAYHDDAPIGGLLGVRFGDRASFFYAAIPRDDGAARFGQGPLLYWEFIQWARRVGATSIDWGGSGTRFPPSPDDPGYGVYHFKSNFGARLVRLSGYYDLVFHPRLYRVVRRLEARVLPYAWGVRARLNPLFSGRRVLG